MWAAAVLLQASIAAPAFAPPLDVPLRITSERIEASPDERHFTLERLVRFSREDRGYRAEALLLANANAAPAALTDLVERGLGALVGRRIVLHLDDKGEVTAIDDMQALWEQVCLHVAQAAASRRSLPPAESAALTARLAGALRALPAERQRALLATLVTAAIMTDAREPAGSLVPVRLPGTSPFGGPLMLEGTRATASADAGLVKTVTTASATVSLPAEAGAPLRTGAVSLERLRVFDPRTGLIATALDTIRNTSGSGPTAPVTRLVTRVRVERTDPANWPR